MFLEHRWFGHRTAQKRKRRKEQRLEANPVSSNRKHCCGFSHLLHPIPAAQGAASLPPVLPFSKGFHLISHN